MIGLIVDNSELNLPLKPDSIRVPTQDPRAPHVQPEMEAAQRHALEGEVGAENWRSWTLHEPPPLSRGGYVWIGDVGQFLQLIWDTANTGVILLSNWGGAAAAIYAAIKVVKRLRGHPKLNRGAAISIAADALQQRLGDKPFQKVSIEAVGDDVEVLAGAYVITFDLEDSRWKVTVDRRQGKAVKIVESRRKKSSRISTHDA